MKQFCLLCYLFFTASLLLAQSVPNDTVKIKRSLFKHKKHKQEATWTPYCSSCEITQFDPETYFKDDDTDGVLNVFDLQLNTPALAPVDSNGVAVDSDGDGVLDFEDAEPKSDAGKDLNYFDQIVLDYKLQLTRNNHLNKKDLITQPCFSMLLFEIDSSQLTPNMIPDLRQLVYLTNRYYQLRVEIDGSYDSGFEINNPDISNRRMFNIAEALLELGADENSIAVLYNDFNKPYASETYDLAKCLSIYANVTYYFVRFY